MSVVTVSPGESIHLGSVVVPGSKSHTIRALFIAGVAHGQSTLLGALESDDTVAARRVLRALGVGIESDHGPWSVAGTGGRLVEPTAQLDAGESGLTARYAAALGPLIEGKITIVGAGRIPKRPMRGVLEAVQRQGGIVDFDYPWSVIGVGELPGGRVDVNAQDSSQMVSAVLVSAALARRETVVIPHGLQGSRGYIDMTTNIMTEFGASVAEESSQFVVEPTGYERTTYTVPPDASAAVYPLVAAAITGTEVTVPGDFRGQPDHGVIDVLELMDCDVTVTESGIFLAGPSALRPLDVDMSRCPDAAVAVAVACVVADGTSRLRGLSSLRLKESNRLLALQTELERAGSAVEIEGDTMIIRPGPLSATRFESHHDHRLAMSLSLLGLLRDQVQISGPGVVNKTWPGFWRWLAQTGAIVSK